MKFKIWDKKNNLGWFPHGEKQWGNLKQDGTIIHGYCDEADEPDPDRFTLCFSTGLKDKYGKLIYEGDILYSKSELQNIETGMLTGRFKVVRDVVIRSEYRAGWVLSKEDNWCLSAEIVSEFYEIIGNRFDNPELLNIER